MLRCALCVRQGSDSAVAATLAARPVYPRKLTTCCNAQVASLGPKHEVAALQPAARGHEPRGLQPAERTAIAGWQGQHDQQALSACNV